MILCFTAQAVRLLDPETAAEFHRRDAVLRRHDQVDGCKQSVSGSLVAWKIVPAVGDVCFLQRLH